MPKTYKAFIKEYDMGLTVPSMSFLKPTTSMKLKRKDEKAKKETKKQKQKGEIKWTGLQIEEKRYQHDQVQV